AVDEVPRTDDAVRGRLVSAASGDDFWVVRAHDRRSWGILVRRFRGWVDPNRVRQIHAPGRAIDEAFRVSGVGSQEHAVSVIEDVLGEAVMHRGRSEEGQAAVVVLGVVPGEERAADLTRVFQGAEAVRELGPILDGS